MQQGPPRILNLKRFVISTIERYSKPRALLHWCFAIVIIWTSIIGFGVSLIQIPEPVAGFIHSLNVSLAALLIPLFIVRLPIE